MRLALLLPVLCLAAFAVRAPTLGLPLEGDSARVAAAGSVLAGTGQLEAPGVAPLMPCLVALAGGAGVRPTTALRWLDVLAACLVAPLVFLLARACAWRPRAALLAGALTAVHPLAVVEAGGIAPGGAALAAVLALGSLLLLAHTRPGVRRAALLPLILLCAAHATMLVLVPPLLVLFVVREPGPRLQTAAGLVVGGAFVASAATWLRFTGTPEAGAAFGWVLGAGLGVLFVGVPSGLSRLVSLPAGRGWICCAVLGAFGWLAGLPFPGVVALALILVAGTEGLLVRWPARAVPYALAGLGCAVLISVGFVAGGLQAAVAPEEPASSGRLYVLRQALRAAAETAGENGWIVLAVAEGRPEEQASLADLNPGHWTWSQRASAADDHALRRLHVFPAASFESGRHVAVLAEAGHVGAIQTFDGAGIFQQEVVREIGPYVVLRARRP